MGPQGAQGAQGAQGSVSSGSGSFIIPYSSGGVITSGTFQLGFGVAVNNMGFVATKNGTLKTLAMSHIEQALIGAIGINIIETDCSDVIRTIFTTSLAVHLTRACQSSAVNVPMLAGRMYSLVVALPGGQDTDIEAGLEVSFP
jgi:hypothetical protein